MKEPIFNKIFFIIFFLLISIKNSTQSELIELNMIADANLNATASFASFDQQQYLYFLYDMNPFFNDNNFRTGAIFKLTSKHRFNSYDISYSFFSKKIDTINSTDLTWNEMYIFWRYTLDYISQRTIDNEYDHFIKINRTLLKQKNLNTLVLRIKVYNKKGDLTIENLLSLSEDIQKALYNKTKNYIYNKNLGDNLNKNNNINYHNNYNNHNYNNNNNYHKNNNNYHNDIYHNNNNYHKDYYNNNYNYNYGNKKYYDKAHYNYHFHRYKKGFHFHNVGFTYAGIIFGQIWTIVFILYCTVNRRKLNNNRLAVIVGNIQQ